MGDPTQFMWISVLSSSQDQSKSLVAPYGCGQAGSVNKALGLSFPNPGGLRMAWESWGVVGDHASNEETDAK